jgi:hypothetical protein
MIAALLYTFPILAFLIIGIATNHRMIIIGAVIALIGNVGYFMATMRDTRHGPCANARAQAQVAQMPRDSRFPRPESNDHRTWVRGTQFLPLRPHGVAGNALTTLGRRSR